MSFKSDKEMYEYLLGGGSIKTVNSKHMFKIYRLNKSGMLNGAGLRSAKYYMPYVNELDALKAEVAMLKQKLKKAK